MLLKVCIATQGGETFALPESLHAHGAEMSNGHMLSKAGAVFENKQLTGMLR